SFVELSGPERILAVVALLLAFVLPTFEFARCLFPRPPPRWISSACVLMALVLWGLHLIVRGFSRMELGRLAPFLVRATHLESGLSPVPPLLLVYVALLVSLLSVLSIIRLDPSFPSFIKEGRKLRLAVAAVVVVWAWYMGGQFRPMLE